MRCWKLLLSAWLLLGLGAAQAAVPARIVKVLPHYLDAQGRHSLSPSLYERDVYQAYLRRHPALCAGLRFDVQWKAPKLRGQTLQLRLELLTATTSRDKPVVRTVDLKASSPWSRWAHLGLEGEAFKEAGEIIAWRTSLWRGGELLAEQKSFLW